jgi:hypothetical protein
MTCQIINRLFLFYIEDTTYSEEFFLEFPPQMRLQDVLKPMAWINISNKVAI